METLETLSNFVKKYPQNINGNLQYSFLGGTAIRLIQESTELEDKRLISDFDILIFDTKGGPYPVHQCSTDDVFGVISEDKKNLKRYVSHIDIKNTRYYHMNGSFLALTKTCAIDTPREKDYKDVKFLYDSGFINEQLKNLFGKASRLTKNSDLSLKIFNWLLEDNDSDKIRLFQTFPRLVNLIDEFSNPEEIKRILLDYAHKDKSKSGYQLASIFYDSHSLLRELKDIKEKDKKKILNGLLKSAEQNDYVDFDRRIHQDLIPRFRYIPQREKKELSKTLINKI